MKNITILGGGVLGSQIAFQTSYSGYNVTIYLRSKESIKRCKKKLEEVKNSYIEAINIMKKNKDINNWSLGIEDFDNFNASKCLKKVNMVLDEIKLELNLDKALKDTDLVFITAGMGGGTGTGAAPVIARYAKEAGCVVVGIVTKPFSFEGTKRMQQALAGIEQMRQYVDTLVIVPNDKLLVGGDIPFLQAFSEADDVLRRGVQGISEIITLPGLINVDFADVKNVLQGKGSALMGIGIASGPNRAIEAARLAISSPLLEVDINGATDAIVEITSDVDITMKEVEDVISEIRNASSTDIDIICGTGFNLELNGEVVVTVIATGFDSTNRMSDDDEQSQQPQDQGRNYNYSQPQQSNYGYRQNNNSYSNYNNSYSQRQPQPQQPQEPRKPYVNGGSTKEEPKDNSNTKVPSWLQNRFR